MADKQPGNSQEKGRADHLEAHRFRPGRSGNPGGRPKGTVSLTALIRREANKNRGRRAKRVVEKLFSMAESGNLKAVELILARTDDSAHGDPNSPEIGGVRFTFNIGDKKINQDAGAPEDQAENRRDLPSDMRGPHS